jgi:peptide/nickel transport system permease protein
MSNVSARNYFARAIGRAIVVIFFVICLNFAMIYMAPGDPLLRLAGDYPIPPEVEAMLRARYGLDQPIYIQLLRYLERVVQGDLGQSYVARIPVLQLILQRLPNSLLLLGSAIFAWIIAVFAGVFVSTRRFSLLDSSFSFSALVGYSLPSFWLGQVLILVFSIYLGWFPTSGMRSLGLPLVGIAALSDVLVHLSLPAGCVGLKQFTLLFRLSRSQMIVTLEKDFITTAFAKGLANREVLLRHALKNSLVPIISIISISLPRFLTQTALVETVFGWPGLGRLLLDSVLTRDYPVLMGVFVVSAVVLVAFSIVADLLVMIVDPRTRHLIRR